MQMNLAGKKVLIFGLLTDDSIAYSCAEAAMGQGAEVLLANAPGRPTSLMQRIAKRLPEEPVACLSADVTEPEQLQKLGEDVGAIWDRVDAVLHAVAFAPPAALGGNFLKTEWADVATAMHVSAYSVKALTVSLLPLLEKAGRASVVSLTFDATVAWPVYDWMGPTKAALESITRYLARDLGPSGIRVNAVDSGPIRSMAGKSIPGFDQLADAWPDRAPLGWDTKDSTPVADTVAFLFSDASRMITGQVIHVDGGYGVVGA
ncbi:enoyl-ACP reductase FabI [Streptomyces sp. ISL-96]|uniref:enoyl-ACP reductase FabI n=1 Tax=Streptomyces sp. ISL-96 TaxID=2819191 RepID=UPI001BEBE256|nr:enoyl-ACP reductase FabI [Streptomyces sp. ISL-96]MBT2491678.1 enoyl-ACP reductase FabI [Streptomyces sp. ISL-96]